MIRFRHLMLLCLGACLGTFLVGCTSGGIDTGNALAQDQISASGVVAQGAAVAFTDVTVRGLNGNVTTATTDADGNYTVDLSTLTPPYFVRADLGGGKYMYAFARKSSDAAIDAVPVGGTDGGSGGGTGPDTGTAGRVVVMNVHPFSDLLITTYYRAQGLDIGTVFNGFGPGSLFPSRDEIEAIVAAVMDVFVRAFPGGSIGYLSDAGAYGSDGLALESSFTPDGTGFDGLLDAMLVAPDRSSFTISNGDVEVVTTITTGTMSSVPVLIFETTTSGPDGTSGDREMILLPSDQQFRDAIAGAQATFKNIVDQVNLKGSALAASDLIPQYALDYRDGGEGRLIAAARMAGLLRGRTVSTEALRPLFYDRLQGILRMGLGPVPLFIDKPLFVGSGAPLDAPPPDPSAPPPPNSPPPYLILRRPPGDFVFKKVGSAWLLYGDQSLARREILSINRTTMNPGGNVNENILVANAVSPAGVITAGQIKSLPDGTGLFPAVTNLFHLPLQRSEPLSPTGNVIDNFTQYYDVYSILQTLGPTPPGVGSDFVITVTSATAASEDPMVQNRPVHAATTEPAMIIVPAGHTMADAIPPPPAPPGQPINVQWTLPRSYPIVSVQLVARSKSGASVCESPRLELIGSPTPDRAAIAVPPVCPGPPPGPPPTSAEIELIVRGPHGEQSEVRYEFQ